MTGKFPKRKGSSVVRATAKRQQLMEMKMVPEVSGIFALAAITAHQELLTLH